MKTLSVIYWARVGLGVIAALICALLGRFFYISFLNGLSLGIIFYMVTYYPLRRWFASKEKEASKAFTMGMGSFFLMWIVTWILLYSIFYPSG